MPRSRRPALSPARPSSSCFLNISTPVTTVLRVSRKPTISHVLAHLHLAALDTARNHRAAARDREDVFDRHQERQVDRARRQRNVRVHRLHQLVDLRFPLRLAVQRAQRRAADDRHVVARVVVLRQQLADFHLHQLDQLRSSTASHLFRNTTMYGTPTWRASSTCSLVCGIGPSVAATTRIAPSICAAPVIMFLM